MSSSELPSLVQLKETNALPPLTNVEERGGPWDSAPLDPNNFPALKTTMPMIVVFRKEQDGWKLHLLIAESALLHRAGAAPGLGVYPIRKFRGSHALVSGKEVAGDVIGHYGGTVVAAAPTQRQADASCNQLVLQGSTYLLTMRVAGHTGWCVVDGSRQPVLPLLHRVNDSRGTPLLPRCLVSETGLFTAARDIPAVDMTKPLRNQAISELSFDYGASYWSVHEQLGTDALPLDVGGVLLPAFEHLQIRAAGSRQRRGNPPPTAVANLSTVEHDADGNVVYVNLEIQDAEPELNALRARLSFLQPSVITLERLIPINRNRVLVEIMDDVAFGFLRIWLQLVMQRVTALRQLFAPLGPKLLLLGGQFIVPRVTEYEPYVRSQTPHTDVDTKGEVIAIAFHVHGTELGTLIHPTARLDPGGNVIGNSVVGRANASAFAFDTGVVHAGPGVTHVPPPYPKFMTERVFVLFCSASLTPSRIAQHRHDNGLHINDTPRLIELE